MTTTEPLALQLTARQREVLAAVWAHWAENGGSPSIRDLMAATSTRHINSMNGILDALERKGAVERGGHGQARGIYPAGLRDVIRATAGDLARSLAAH